MSDFLKKFSKDAYQNVVKPDFSKVENECDDTEIEEEKQPIKKAPTKTHEILTKTKSEEKDLKEIDRENGNAGRNTTFKTSNIKEEVFVRDDEKIKNRKKKMIIAGVCTVMFIGVSIFVYFKINEVRMPQFVYEKTLNDVQVWAAKNKMELDYTSRFSTKVDEGYIIKQSKKKGTMIQKGSDFNVVVSKGADPEQHIEIPDFMKMSITEVEAWKQKEKASNVKIEKVFSEEVEKGKTISFEYLTEAIDANNYRRKDKIKVIVSKGKETFEKNIEVPDFKNKLKMEVESWASENEINVEYTEEANDKIVEGSVISQSVVPKTKIAKKDSMKVVISKGKVSYAPDFYGLDETQGQIAAAKAEVATNSVCYYSNTVKASSLISQSLPAGSEITNQVIILTYSLGKPYIANYEGEDINTMILSINEMNTKGAKLTYEIIEVNATERKGSIITSNYKASFVDVGTHIVINVSNGI